MIRYWICVIRWSLKVVKFWWLCSWPLTLKANIAGGACKFVLPLDTLLISFKNSRVRLSDNDDDDDDDDDESDDVIFRWAPWQHAVTEFVSWRLVGGNYFCDVTWRPWRHNVMHIQRPVRLRIFCLRLYLPNQCSALTFFVAASHTDSFL